MPLLPAIRPVLDSSAQGGAFALSARPPLPGATLQRLLACTCIVLLALLLAGCAASPRVPDWQLEAHGAQQRAMRAELEGRERVAAAEWQRALEATRRTARADWLARIELSRCALRQTALDLQACSAVQALLPHASAAEQAYARYLQAQVQPADPDLLPQPHRAVARHLLAAPQPQPQRINVPSHSVHPRSVRPELVEGPQLQPGRATALLRAIDDPLARLLAASVLLRAQRLELADLPLAIDTASEQGWQRPLLAWLLLQQQWAQQAGQSELAAQARQRADWLSRPGAGAP